MFLLYGVGFASVWVIMGLMHLHAYRRAADLELNPIERLVTRGQIGVCVSRVLIALVSICIAALAPAQLIGLAGWSYFLMCITETVHGMSVGRRARLLAATESADQPIDRAHPPRG